jgi:hypothetical protein
MSPALAPIPPRQFKAILEKAGYSVESETKYNWTLFKADAPVPVIVLPRKGKLVSVTVMMGVLDQISMNITTYFTFLKQIQN